MSLCGIVYIEPQRADRNTLYIKTKILPQCDRIFNYL